MIIYTALQETTSRPRRYETPLFCCVNTECACPLSVAQGGPLKDEYRQYNKLTER